jgi:hypothetical protein
VVEFLWATVALFDDETATSDTATVRRPRPFELNQVRRPANVSCDFSPRRRRGCRSSDSCPMCRTMPMGNPG